jgi:hypothetical protein
MSNKVPTQTTAKTHLANSLKLAEESRQIGMKTIVTMDEQSEQLRRIQADAEDTEVIMKGNQRVVKDMRRFWFVRMCCYNRQDIVPAGPTWDHRDTPEEQQRVNKMIKLEKRRRVMRRRSKKGEEGGQSTSPSDGKQAGKAPVNKSSWKFWQKRSNSDLSSISEESGDEATIQPNILPSPAPKVVDKYTRQVIIYETEADIHDEEGALDTLRSTVTDLKAIALQISETASAQTVALGTVHKQIDKNQIQLEKNQVMVGKLGRKAKEDGDNGLLSAQDKLAIAGVRAAITTRMN